MGGAAVGDEITASPYVNIRNESNDNLFNTVEDKTEDVMTNVSSGIDLIKSDDRWNSSLLAEAAAKAYSENSELDNVDKRILSSFTGRPTERMDFSLNAGLTSDSRNDWDFDETGMIDGDRTLKKVIRKDADLGVTASFDVSEITTTTFVYDLTVNEFDDPEYLDFTSHNILLRLNREVSGPIPGMEIYAQAGYYWYQSVDSPLLHPVYGENYEKETNLNSLSILAGTAAFLRENLRLRVQYGGRYIVSNSLSSVLGTSVAEEEYEGLEQLGQITLSYGGEKNSWDALLRHDIRPRTGSGVFVKNTAARFNYIHEFTGDFRAGIQAGYYFNLSRDSVEFDQIEERTIRAQVNVIYFLTRVISIECKYDYSLIQNLQDQTDNVRNKVMIGASIRYPVTR